MTPPADLPVGPALPGFEPPPAPAHAPLVGRHVRLEPLWRVGAEELAVHGRELCAALDPSGASWTYLPYGPLTTAAEVTELLASIVAGGGVLPFAVRAGDGPTVGLVAYLNVVPRNGSVEIGHVHLGTPLARTRAATEAFHLMMAAPIEAGYRRVEWKCDALNAASRRAALRLGFREEGTFRSHVVYKGRSRDTAWFAVTDEDWPAVRAGQRAWLADGNFGADGGQVRRLGDLIATS